MSSGEDNKHQSTNQETTGSTAQQPESRSDPASTKAEGDEKPPTTAAPLAPPPKPSQHSQSQTQQTPDYFSSGGGGGGPNNSHFSLEPNPFEQSFGNPSTGETPNKVGGGLPSVASLTSPAPLRPGGTPNWDSLRTGPLSPAMLQGPVNTRNGYFDQEFRNNYPTPNESSLRTGLTPGGGGSMFPAPSPNTQAIFNNLGGGGVTPGTAEFQRAAAAARQKIESHSTNGQTMNKQEYQPAQQQGRQDPFANQQEHEAVNSLYMLAQPTNRSAGTNANQFAVPTHQPSVSQINANMSLQQRMAAQQQQQQHQQNQSPTQGRNNGSVDLGSGGNDDEDGEDDKPTTRSKGKKNPTSKSNQAANGRRKADETPAKAPAKKRSRGNNGSVNEIDMDEEMSDDDNVSVKDETGQQNGSGRKMTDEEKRKNFLERNRVAALKCRQRKKQWLANLQTKVEIYTQENDALTSTCSQLREEIINLKTLLLAHKDCAVSHQQGLGGQAMAQFMGNMDPQAGAGGPFMVGQGGMHMPHMSGQGMQQSMQSGQSVQRH